MSSFLEDVSEAEEEVYVSAPSTSISKLCLSCSVVCYGRQFFLFNSFLRSSADALSK
jgi:hypothetical protein